MAPLVTEIDASTVAPSAGGHPERCYWPPFEDFLHFYVAIQQEFLQVSSASLKHVPLGQFLFILVL